MGRKTKFLLGAGIGAAQVYYMKKNQDDRDARLAALIRGDKPPGKPLPALASAPAEPAVPTAPVAALPPVTLPAPAETSSVAEVTPDTSLPPPPLDTPEQAEAPPLSEETVAFNDDVTVPNTPIHFENSYA